MKRSEKKDFVSNLKEDFSNATSVIVAEYSGLTVNETEQLRKEMRDNGAKFKVTKNRLTKLAISETQFKDISELFKVPTAIAPNAHHLKLGADSFVSVMGSGLCIILYSRILIFLKTT